VYGEAGGQTGSIAMIALVAIVAFVIVLLAFFFRADITPHGVMIGLPHDKEAPGVTYTQLGAPERLNTTPRISNTQSTVVREDGLP
jgi:hypothetical protein